MTTTSESTITSGFIHNFKKSQNLNKRFLNLFRAKKSRLTCQTTDGRMSRSEMTFLKLRRSSPGSKIRSAISQVRKYTYTTSLANVTKD